MKHYMSSIVQVLLLSAVSASVQEVQLNSSHPILITFFLFQQQCPIDTRKQLAENLVIIGGTSMLPGFLHRLLAEIRYLVEKPKYKKTLGTKNFRIHTPPAKADCVAWLGGKNLVLSAITSKCIKVNNTFTLFKTTHLISQTVSWVIYLTISLNSPPLGMMFDVGRAQALMMMMTKRKRKKKKKILFSTEQQNRIIQSFRRLRQTDKV